MYGTYSPPSDCDDEDSNSEDSFFLSSREDEDEEASIETPVTPGTPVGPTESDRGPYGNLSPRAIIWIVLPMLLG